MKKNYMKSIPKIRNYNLILHFFQIFLNKLIFDSVSESESYWKLLDMLSFFGISKVKNIISLKPKIVNQIKKK